MPRRGQLPPYIIDRLDRLKLGGIRERPLLSLDEKKELLLKILANFKEVVDYDVKASGPFVADIFFNTEGDTSRIEIDVWVRPCDLEAFRNALDEVGLGQFHTAEWNGLKAFFSMLPSPYEELKLIVRAHPTKKSFGSILHNIYYNRVSADLNGCAADKSALEAIEAGVFPVEGIGNDPCKLSNAVNRLKVFEKSLGKKLELKIINKEEEDAQDAM